MYGLTELEFKQCKQNSLNVMFSMFLYEPPHKLYFDYIQNLEIEKKINACRMIFYQQHYTQQRYNFIKTIFMRQRHSYKTHSGGFSVLNASAKALQSHIWSLFITCARTISFQKTFNRLFSSNIQEQKKNYCLLPFPFNFKLDILNYKIW